MRAAGCTSVGRLPAGRLELPLIKAKSAGETGFFCLFFSLKAGYNEC